MTKTKDLFGADEAAPLQNVYYIEFFRSLLSRGIGLAGDAVAQQVFRQRNGPIGELSFFHGFS